MLSRSDGVRRCGDVGDGDKRRILDAYGEWNVGINSTHGRAYGHPEQMGL